MALPFCGNGRGGRYFFTTAYFPPKPCASFSAGDNGLLYLQKFFHATGFCFLLPAGEEGFRALSGNLV